jgi:multiple sugar transport system permease protein
MQSQATVDQTVARAATMRRRRRRIDPYPYLLVAPAMLFILIVTVYPSLYAIRLSLFDANLLRFAASEFVGIDNYVAAFSDEIFLESVWRTVRWIVVIATSLLVVALPVALLLNRNFVGRGMVRTAVLIPWVIPGAVVAIIWRYLTDSNHGIIGDLLVRAGILDAPIPWISQPIGAFVIIVIAMVWAGFPFFAITLLAALQVIPNDLYESAKVDGATNWQSFRFITFPMLLPTILMLLLIRSIWLSHAVDLPFMMTNGGPGYSNYTVAVYSFLLTHSQLEIGYPAALAVMLAIVLLAASAIYIRLIERSRDWM